MVRLFNIFRKKYQPADMSYRSPELLPAEVWMKYNMDPFERYQHVLNSSAEGMCILELIHRLQDNWLVTNEEIEKAFDAFAFQQQSNAVYIAQLYFVVLAQLGYYRNEIIPVLIIYPMRAFYHATGSIAYKELLQFINENLIEYKITPYGGLPPDGEMMWLKNHLADSEVLITELFHQLVREKN